MSAASTFSVPVVDGLRSLAEGKDGLVLDLWGVVHGGLRPFPGVLDTFAAARAAGLPIALVSNAPRRAAAAAAKLERIGVASSCYDAMVTSGEMARDWLAERAETIGRRFVFIGTDMDDGLLAGLPFEATAAVAKADFLLVCGFPDETQPVETFDPVLAPAAARGLPLICANADRIIRREGFGIAPCAGLIADRYEVFGGRTVRFGKPDPAAFGRARAALGLAAAARLIVVGDSLETDIKGALAAGMEAVLVTRGVHADALGVVPGEAPDSDTVAALCAAHDLRPVAALPTLRW